jgi:hypothetical protein
MILRLRLGAFRQMKTSALARRRSWPINTRYVYYFNFLRANQCLNHPQSITRVDEIHTSPSRFKVGRRTDASTGTGRHRLKNSDLPAGTADRFAKEVIPLAFEVAGVLDPWDTIINDDIIDNWNLVFNDDHPIASGDYTGDVFLAVRSLVRCLVYYLLIMSLTIVCSG